MVWSAQYNAFGNVSITTPLCPSGCTPADGKPIIESNLRFPGQIEDAETGLYYNWHRYYDPELGRYVTADPIGVNGGMNMFTYVGGNPVSFIDPNGLYCRSTPTKVYCKYPGGPEFVVPRPVGFPDDIREPHPLHPIDSIRHHKYNVETSIGCADPNKVMQNVINSPTQGDNPKPASPDGTSNNANTIFGDNYVTSYVTKDMVTGVTIVVNMTGSRSDFAQGYTARMVINGELHTYGEGNDPYQAIPEIGRVGAEVLWQAKANKNIPESNCPCNE